MASLSSSISSLFSGLSYLISAFFESIFAILRHILNLFENILSTLVGAIRESVHAAADVLGHVVKFLAGQFGTDVHSLILHLTFWSHVTSHED